MRVLIYNGGFQVVSKSGVGQAVLHQRQMLQSVKIQQAQNWNEPFELIHLNTVLPDSVFAALRARLAGKKVIYHGHSTMQDFCHSFVGSDFLAPLFKLWISFCYRLGDVVLTPTEYSKQLLEGYGLHRRIVSISNGVDTEFFAPNPALRQSFRERYHLADEQRAVISVGHIMERKGVLDFIALARQMPDTRFFWFGHTDPALIPDHVRRAVAQAPQNLLFVGYQPREMLREAYCGADLFAFLSHEETEGIVVLEALACKIPTLLRDIPVYSGWLTDTVNVYKAADDADIFAKTEGILSGFLPNVADAGLGVAHTRSIDCVARQLEQVYTSALAAPAHRRTAGLSRLLPRAGRSAD